MLCGTNITHSHWIRPRARHTPVLLARSSPSMWFPIPRSTKKPAFPELRKCPSPLLHIPPLSLLLLHISLCRHWFSFFFFFFDPIISLCEIRIFGSIEMALASSRVSSPFLSTIVGDTLKKPISSSSSVSFAFSVPSSSSSLSLGPKAGGSRNFRVYASASSNSPALTGVIFEPFEEVKKDFLAVPISPQVSMARQNYVDECESAINEQIKCVFLSFSAFLYICFHVGFICI